MRRSSYFYVCIILRRARNVHSAGMFFTRGTKGKTDVMYFSYIHIRTNNLHDLDGVINNPTESLAVLWQTVEKKAPECYEPQYLLGLVKSL